MSRILIMGSGGRLGVLLKAARARDGSHGHEIVLQSRNPMTDVCWSPEQPLSRLPAADVVVGLWGVTAGDQVALRENTSLAVLSLRVADAVGAGSVLHLSSAGVYGPGRAMTERATPKPSSAYGQSKLDMENYIKQNPQYADVKHLILRLANVVGADSLAPALRGADGVILDRFENFKGPMRSYVAPGDVLKVISALCETQQDEQVLTLNVAAKESVAMEDLAQAAGRQVTWKDAPSTAIQTVTLDVANLLHLVPHVHMQNTAQGMVEDWQELETMA